MKNISLRKQTHTRARHCQAIHSMKNVVLEVFDKTFPLSPDSIPLNKAKLLFQVIHTLRAAFFSCAFDNMRHIDADGLLESK